MDDVERLLAQSSVVHGDEPLVRGAEDNRLMATPAVRIAVGNLLFRDERPLFAQPFDDERVRFVDVHARKASRSVREDTVVVDGHERRDVELLRDQIVVHTMAGSGMDSARTRVHGDVVAVDDATFQVLADRAGVSGSRKVFAFYEHFGARGITYDLIVIPAGNPRNRLNELFREQMELSCGANHAVVGFRREAYRRVSRKRPRGRGPNQHVSRAFDPSSSKGGRNFVEQEVHEDRRRNLVRILNLRLGERRMAALAPMDRLAPTVDSAVKVHLLEDFDVASLVVRHERQVRMLPVGVHAQALEAFALHVDVLLRPITACLANFRLRRLGELLRAHGLFDHVLNGLAMAVPAGNVGRVVAALRVAFVHKVLQNLVECMADVDRSVRVRRAVVQNEGLTVLVLLQDLMVDILLRPLRQALWLVLGQVCAHGKVGLRQVHRVLVGVRHVPDLSSRDSS